MAAARMLSSCAGVRKRSCRQVTRKGVLSRMPGLRTRAAKAELNTTEAATPVSFSANCSSARATCGITSMRCDSAASPSTARTRLTVSTQRKSFCPSLGRPEQATISCATASLFSSSISSFGAPCITGVASRLDKADTMPRKASFFFFSSSLL